MEYHNQTQQELIDALHKANEENKALKKIESDLNQRVKELNCHNEVTSLISRTDLTVDEIIQQIVELIPSSCQFSELVEAAITVNGKTFQTKLFRSTSCYVVQDVKVGGRKMGEIVVGYRGKQALNKAVFSTEEAKLFFSIAGRIANFIDRTVKTAQLVKTEDKFKSLIESINDIVYEYDSKGVLKYISPVVEKLFGFSVDEVIGQNFIKFVGGDDAFVAKKLSDLQKYKVVNAEYKTFSKSGDARWINLSTTAVYDGDVFIGGAGILTDITQKKLVELELQRSESLYRSILSASPDAITIADMNGKISFASPINNKMFGYDASYNFVGHYVYDYITLDEHAKAQYILAVNAQGTLTGVEKYKGLKADGSTISLEINTEIIYDDANVPVKVLLVVRDITSKELLEDKLSRSESQYKNLVESINEVIYEIDKEGIVVYVSPAIQQMGYLPEEMIGKSFLDFAGDKANVLYKNLLALKNGEQLTNEYELYSKSGQCHWLRFSTKAVYDEEGNFKGGNGTMIDVTEIKQVQLALKNSEEKYRNIFETVQDAYCESTIDGVILDISPAIERISKGQFKRDELIGKSLIQFYAHPEEREAFYRELARNNSVIDYELALRNKDGSVVPIAVTSTLVLDAAGKPLKITGSMRDVSERKLAAEAIRISEEKYRLLFANNPQPMWIYDLETLAILEVNEYSMRQYGYSREEFLQMAIKDIRPLEDIPELLSDVGRAARNESNKGIWRHIWKNGELRYVEITAQPIEFNGRKARHVLINDVTDQHLAKKRLEESEERFRQVVEQTADLIAIADTNGFVTYASPTSVSMFQRTPEEMVGLNFLTFAADAEIENAEKQFRKILESDEVVKDAVFLMKRKDGTLFYAELNGSKFQTSSHEGVLVTIRDITDRNNTQANLRKLSRAIEQSPVSVVITDTAGDIEYANPKAIETTGYTLEELIGQNPRVLKSGETSKEEYVELWKTISSGKEWHGTFHNKRKTGEKYWESSSISPVFDESGKISNYVAIKEDITAKKLVEQALKDSEENLRFAQKIAKMGSWEFDVKTQEVRWSENEYNLFGLDMNANVNLKDYFVSRLHSEDKHSQEEVLQNILTFRGTTSKEFRFIMPDGSVKWIQGDVSPIIDGDEIIQLIGTHIDITDKKLAEQALIKNEASLNYAQELADMGSWELNFITNEFNRSDNYYRLLGVEPQKEGISNNYFHENLYFDDRILLDQMLQEVTTTRKSSFRDVRFVMPDGSIKWIQDIVNPTFKGEQIIGINGVIFDITGKKKVQDQLKRSEVSLNYSQQIANMGSWELNLITNEYTWSENNYLLVGMVPFEKEITIETFYQLLHPDDISYLNDSIQYIFESKLPVSINMRIILPNGQIRWFQNNIVPVFEDNELIALKGVNIDITERKQKDDQINKLSLVATHSPVSIVITDLKGNIEFVNPAFEEMTGYDFEMIKGKNTRILKSGRNNKTVYENLWSTINKGNIWQDEWVNKRLNGEFYWESISITPIFNESGDIENFMALKQDVTNRKQSEQEIRDLNLNLEKKIQERTSELANTNIDLLNEISERKKTEQKFSTAFHSSTVLMAISSYDDGKYIDVNDKFLNTIGFSREEVIGKTFKDLGIYNDVNARQRIIENINTGIPVNEVEMGFVTKSGENRISLLSANLIYIGDQKCLLAVSVDITDRKNMENEIMKARMEADKANVAKSEFLSRMSHELRTPMNSILGFAQILEMGELNAGQRKGVNHIMRSGKHLLGLINEVLDISRIEAGRLSISIEPIKLNVLLEEMLDVVQPLAVEHQIQMELTVGSDNNLFVKSDRQSLRQIMLNLLNNAIKYNKPAGSVQLKTELITANSTEPDFVRISIIDTGIGISAEDIPKLFTPFERIGASKTGVEGTGLGLAVVKKLVEAMGGSLGVESVLNEGSTFWLQLPKADNQLEILHSESLIQTSQLSSGKTGLILYIEDNVSNIELIEQILAYQRPLVRIVSNMNGSQAVSLAVEHQPNLILLDLNLPDINGDEVLRLLKANDKTRDIPVVIISADAMNKHVGDLLSLGAKSYLAKPLDVTDFLGIIDEFI